MYATFGSKRELFEQALLRYADQGFGPIIAKLRASETPLETIQVHFRSLAALHGQVQTFHGCLIINSSVELSPHDARIAEMLRERWAALEEAFEALIRRGQAMGEIDAGRSSRALARLCVTTIRGLGVDAKLDRDPQLAAEVVELLLSCFETGPPDA